MSRFQWIVISILGFIVLVVLAAVAAAILFLMPVSRQVAPPPPPPPPAAPAAATATVAPTPTYIRYEFAGKGSRIESFRVHGPGPTYFFVDHVAERSTQTIRVDLKDTNGETIKYLIWEQGTTQAEAVENLSPGEYLLEIDGVDWVVGVSPGQ